MKTLQSKELFAWIALTFALVLFCITIGFAQELKINIHVEKQTNGMTQSFDTSFTTHDPYNAPYRILPKPFRNPVPNPDPIPYLDSTIIHHEEMSVAITQDNKEQEDLNNEMKDLQFEFKGDDGDGNNYNFNYNYDFNGSLNGEAFPNMPDFKELENNFKNFRLKFNLDSLLRNMNLNIMMKDVPGEGEKESAEERKAMDESNSIADNINIYPNPSNGQLNINFNLKEKGDLNIRITDVSGKEIVSERLKDFTGDYSNIFDLSHLGKGIYIVSIEQNKQLFTKKIMIN